MVLKILLFSLLTTVTFAQCSTSKSLPEIEKSNHIKFGTGGGFAGIENGFYLFDNGMIVKQAGFSDSLTLVNQIDLNTCNQIFNNYEMLELSKIDINDPGNMYKFVKYVKEGTEHKLVWSGKSSENNLNLFYKNLQDLTKFEN
jgi:hypothetical protein